ncbi:hypothetical protein M595_0538 [Lyngbya aestuarii BL J]|uniref:Uncharacterized protein n=1 Tax=Lyngbya aestuarii BL J TaxID=1348334 RepID=U7QSV0_9CYAN|nr:hypothetical protein M595_0538 [Lyngbya aestuarii BL J]
MGFLKVFSENRVRQFGFASAHRNLSPIASDNGKMLYEYKSVINTRDQGSRLT